MLDADVMSIQTQIPLGCRWKREPTAQVFNPLTSTLRSVHYPWEIREDERTLMNIYAVHHHSALLLCEDYCSHVQPRLCKNVTVRVLVVQVINSAFVKLRSQGGDLTAVIARAKVLSTSQLACHRTQPASPWAVRLGWISLLLLLLVVFSDLGISVQRYAMCVSVKMWYLCQRRDSPARL